jgi:phosphopantothenate---cysteine ligase (CTP)
MNCVVTAGPTCEPLDQVRRLTNFSTGKLGSGLADFLFQKGHHVILFKSASATCLQQPRVSELQRFNTTSELERGLQSMAARSVDALFHAAAVSDFSFGRIFARLSNGELAEVKSGKLSSRHGPLLAELVPTPKIILELRDWFPKARLIGWKYEVEGGQAEGVAAARQQIEQSRTDACVLNGPAYGNGFGFVARDASLLHLPDDQALFQSLAEFIGR